MLIVLNYPSESSRGHGRLDYDKDQFANGQSKMSPKCIYYIENSCFMAILFVVTSYSY